MVIIRIQIGHLGSDMKTTVKNQKEFLELKNIMHEMKSSLTGQNSILKTAKIKINEPQGR